MIGHGAPARPAEVAGWWDLPDVPAAGAARFLSMTEMSGSGEARAEFEIELTPGEALLPGTGRFDFTKTWRGDLAGTSQGVLLSAGDPASGRAGYVALETFEGELFGDRGAFVLQQHGILDGGAVLTYGIVPGSGTGQLAGISGTVDLSVDDEGHRVRLSYALSPDA